MEARPVTDVQRLFLVQARADFALFELLGKRKKLPACHRLHALQMATELLGKAHAWKHGPNAASHRAFVGFLRSLRSNRRAQTALGYARKNDQWVNLIRKSIPAAEGIESLAPALTPDGPNPEYPWPRAEPQIAPAEHDFQIWHYLEATNPGRQFLEFLSQLFASAESFL